MKKIAWIIICIILALILTIIIINLNSLDVSRKFSGNFAETKQFHNENLIIENETYLIENREFELNGDLIIKNNGKLIVKDSILRFRQDYNSQYYLKSCLWEIVQGPCSAEIILDNVKIYANNKWIYFNYGGNTSVSMNKVNSWNSNGPWHSAADNSRFSITDSIVGITPGGNTIIETENSNMFIELYISYMNATFRLPKGKIGKFDLDVRNEVGIVQIRARNTYFRDWGATLNKYANITFIDSSLTIGMNAGTDWPGNINPVVKVSNLKNGKYDDFSLDFDTNRLKLINTKTRDWYPQGRGNSTVEISNSDLADINYNGETATIIVRNSNAAIAIGRMNATYLFYDSKINGDVSATENSQIYLYNTTASGNFNEAGNGKIFINGERLIGKLAGL